VSDETIASENNEQEAKPVKKRFSKARKRIELELEDADHSIKDYVLIEMSGAVRDRWLAEQAAKVKIDPKTNKPTGIRDFDKSLAGLISKCLFLMPGEKPVSAEEIQTWSSSLQKELSDQCAELNGLTAEAAEEAKKD